MTPTDIPDSLDDITTEVQETRTVFTPTGRGSYESVERTFHLTPKAKSAIQAWAYREFIEVANKATIRREAGFNLHTSQMKYIDVVDKAELRAKAAAHFNQKETT